MCAGASDLVAAVGVRAGAWKTGAVPGAEGEALEANPAVHCKEGDMRKVTAVGAHLSPAHSDLEFQEKKNPGLGRPETVEYQSCEVLNDVLELAASSLVRCCTSGVTVRPIAAGGGWSVGVFSADCARGGAERCSRRAGGCRGPDSSSVEVD